MLPLLVWAALTCLLRAAGVRSWRVAGLHAMSITSVVIGAAVFTPMRGDMVRMVPAGVPHPETCVIAAGVGQMTFGALLAVPATRPAAAGFLVALTIAKLPANWKAVHEGLSIRGPLPTPPWMRLPDAVAWITILVWIGGARSHRPGCTLRPHRRWLIAWTEGGKIDEARDARVRCHSRSDWGRVQR